MTSNTLSATARAIQNTLSELNDQLEQASQLANDIGLAPFRLAHIHNAIRFNQHAWNELNDLATALELTTADHKP